METFKVLCDENYIGSDGKAEQFPGRGFLYTKEDLPLERETPEKADKAYENKCAAVDKEYGEKARSELNISLDELQDRVVSQWTETAWEKDYKNMEKACLATTDPKEADQLYAKLEARYSTATAREKQLYREWQDGLEACWNSIDWNSPVNRDDLASVLRTFNL
ncbi:hypothetical protein NE619_13995 [Anaerovorax odorimutans]|uniref:Uncharacterized protein n=1 Tax=Anaerovorax odorimutans TaxID=109327 RepID=A0ABT1RRM2_9FIRM|nr:hypothetical protein [Anaerovorax odorimutans]MCQ4637843.1 hypothetical protein [Anaerovorax odorimutans]